MVTATADVRLLANSSLTEIQSLKICSAGQREIADTKSQDVYNDILTVVLESTRYILLSEGKCVSVWFAEHITPCPPWKKCMPAATVTEMLEPLGRLAGDASKEGDKCMCVWV